MPEKIRSRDLRDPLRRALEFTHVLVDGTRHWPMDDELGLGVVPQQVALVVEQSLIALYPPGIRQLCKNNPALGRVKLDGGSGYTERSRDLAAV